MLETYGKDKGVRRAFKILKELGEDYDFEITLIGGPNEKIDEIKNDFKNYKGEINFQYKIPKDEVPYQMSKLDIDYAISKRFSHVLLCISYENI